MPMGEISKTECGCTVTVGYDQDTKKEGMNMKGEKAFLYKCYPSASGNVTPELVQACSRLRGVIAAPATILKELLKNL